MSDFEAVIPDPVPTVSPVPPVDIEIASPPPAEVVEAPSRIPFTLASVTVAHAMLGLLLAAAAILRLTSLGSLPLSLAEAPPALLAFNTWQPEQAGNLIGYSPFYVNGTALLFSVLTVTDAVARLLPALLGIALVGSPWLLREHIGRFGALFASALLMASPLLTITSRTANGDAAALLCGMLLVCGWLRWQHGNSGGLILAAAALGAGLTTTPMFYLIVAAVAGTMGLQRLIGPSLRRADSPLDAAARRRAVVAGVVMFLMTGTLLLWRPDGIGASAALLSEWIQSYITAAGAAERVAPFYLIVRYELPLVILGIIAIGWATWRGGAVSMILVYWLVVSVILNLLSGGLAHGVLTILLPATLLIGYAFDRAMVSAMTLNHWLVMLAVALAGFIVLVNLGRFSRVYNPDVPDQAYGFGLMIVAGLLIALAVSLIALNLTGDYRVILQGSILGLLIVALYFNWGNAWWLSQTAANDPRASWVEEAPAADIRQLAVTVSEVSRQFRGAPQDIDLVSAVDSASLRWYLRDLRNVSYGAIVGPSTDATAVITYDTVEPVFRQGYFGTSFAVEDRLIVVEQASSVPFLETVRRWFYRDDNRGLTTDRAVLWIRTSEVENERLR